MTHGACGNGITRRLSLKRRLVQSVYASSGHGGSRSRLDIPEVWDSDFERSEKVEQVFVRS